MQKVDVQNVDVQIVDMQKVDLQSSAGWRSESAGISRHAVGGTKARQGRRFGGGQGGFEPKKLQSRKAELGNF